MRQALDNLILAMSDSTVATVAIVVLTVALVIAVSICVQTAREIIALCDEIDERYPPR